MRNIRWKQQDTLRYLIISWLATLYTMWKWICDAKWEGSSVWPWTYCWKISCRILRMENFLRPPGHMVRWIFMPWVDILLFKNWCLVTSACILTWLLCSWAVVHRITIEIQLPFQLRRAQFVILQRLAILNRTVFSCMLFEILKCEVIRDAPVPFRPTFRMETYKNIAPSKNSWIINDHLCYFALLAIYIQADPWDLEQVISLSF